MDLTQLNILDEYEVNHVELRPESDPCSICDACLVCKRQTLKKGAMENPFFLLCCSNIVIGHAGILVKRKPEYFENEKGGEDV